MELACSVDKQRVWGVIDGWMECSEQRECVNNWTVLVSTTRRWKVYESGGKGAQRFEKRGEEGVAPFETSGEERAVRFVRTNVRLGPIEPRACCREERLLTTQGFAATRDCEAQQNQNT